MALIFWIRKKLSRFRLQTPKRLTLPASSVNSLALPHMHELVLDADLRCANCQKRVSSVISNVDDLESIVVHVLEKKITLTRKST